MNSNEGAHPYRIDDYEAVRRIYLATAYAGRTLTPELFRDPALFAALYLDCYANIDTYRKNFFVYRQNGRIAGYINGALSTSQFNLDYCAKQVPLIQERVNQLTPADLYHRERTIAEAVVEGYTAQQRSSPPPNGLAEITTNYPAHLHINVSPDVQRGGVGSTLLRRYEEHCRAHGIAGIHLITSNYNTSACAFYEKQRYKSVQQIHASLWPELTDCLSIVYVKRL